MPGPRTPTKILQLRGVEKKDPKRLKARENEPQETRALGEPPDTLSEAERAIWVELAENAIPGVLGKADRAVLEATSKLLARLRNQQAVDDVRRQHVMEAIEQVEDDAVIYALRLLLRYVTAPPPFGSSDQSNLTTLLRQMGMAPADRSKISVDPLKK